MNVKDRINELICLINKADYEYYVLSKPTLSDSQYDKLYNELLNLEKSSNIVLSSSPTQRVSGGVVDYLKKVKHVTKMLSLDKTKDVNKLKSWLGTRQGIISFKLDGLTIVLYYDEGELQKAVTRGNGEIGEDITHNIHMFKNVPLKIPIKSKVVVRGEALISRKDFNKINETLPDSDKYKNPRNLCSGTVRQLDSKNLKNRNVNFYLFDVITTDILNSDSRRDSFEQMRDLGFSIVPYKDIDINNFDEVFNCMSDEAYSVDLPIDGLVVSYDSISYGRSLGTTAHHDRHSMAFKWSDEVYDTTLLNIEWNTSRTGILTPVAVFSPIDIDGSTICRASLHNLSIVKELELGIGDTIQVYKANMIIPQIDDNLTRSNTFSIPRICPSCGENVSIETSPTGVETVVCSNKKCPAQNIFKLEHFCSRDAMNIKGLSEKTIEVFINEGFLNDFDDIYKLKEYRSELIRLPRFGEKSIDNILNSIEDSKNTDLPNFLYSLGITAIGKTNSKLLCQYFNYDLDKIMNASFDELIRIDSYGEQTVNEILNFFSDEKTKEMINKLLKYISINKVDENKKAKETLITDKIFVITGKLDTFKNRKELENLIIDNGGIVKLTVSKTTDYLINNDVNSTSSKNLKAKQLGVQIISEEDFLNMIGGDNNV